MTRLLTLTDEQHALLVSILDAEHESAQVDFDHARDEDDVSAATNAIGAIDSLRELVLAAPVQPPPSSWEGGGD